MKGRPSPDGRQPRCNQWQSALHYKRRSSSFNHLLKEKAMPALTAVFIIDPPERLDPPTDTSLALMRESLRRGQQVYYCTLSELRLDGGTPRARVRPVAFAPGAELFTAGEEREL